MSAAFISAGSAAIAPHPDSAPQTHSPLPGIGGGACGTGITAAYRKKVVIGESALYLGDCLDFIKSVPDKAYDLAIVDPPYFDGPNKSGYYGKGYSSLGVQRAKHYDALASWDVPAPEYFTHLKRVSKHQIIWGANHFADRFNSAGAGWIVWDKLNGESSFADAELAYSSFDKAVRVFRYVWNGMHQGSYGGDMRKNEKRIHPTQKPVALYEWLLAKYAVSGNKILDTHMGSASSVIAAMNMGFQIDAIELDAMMFGAAERRIAEAADQLTSTRQLFAPALPRPEQMNLEAT